MPRPLPRPCRDLCRYDGSCTSVACSYAHKKQPHAFLKFNNKFENVCSYGSKCTYGRRCMNSHQNMPKCRYDSRCTNVKCNMSHTFLWGDWDVVDGENDDDVSDRESSTNAPSTPSRPAELTVENAMDQWSSLKDRCKNEIGDLAYRILKSNFAGEDRLSILLSCNTADPAQVKSMYKKTLLKIHPDQISGMDGLTKTLADAATKVLNSLYSSKNSTDSS